MSSEVLRKRVIEPRTSNSVEKDDDLVAEEKRVAQNVHDKWLKILRLILGIITIYTCHLTQGVLQESIYRHKISGKRDQRFTYPIFLVSCGASLSGLWGWAIVQSTGVRNSVLYQTWRKGNWTQSHLFREGFLISITYMGAMIATNFALTRVNYPTQVLVKSAKAVPVILGGVLFYRRKYPLSDWIVVGMVTASLVIFQVGNLMKASSAASSLTGFVALCISLTLDGVTGPRQDKLVEKYHLNTGEIMLLINFFSSPIGWICSCLLEGLAPWRVIYENLDFYFPRIILFVMCGAIGQTGIVYVLRELGSLHLTLITTIRKFVAILISVLWFGHSLTLTQWLAIVLLFTSGYVKYIS